MMATTVYGPKRTAGSRFDSVTREKTMELPAFGAVYEGEADKH
jgi:hypothetical protein